MDKLDYDSLITNEAIVGIEFLSDGVKIISLKGKGDQLKLVGYGFGRYQPSAFSGGLIRDEKLVVSAIKKAISSSKPTNISPKYVNVSLPDTKVFVRVVSFPGDMSKDEIQESLQFKAKSLIAMPIENVYWDWHRIPNTKSSKEMKVVLAAADKECVDSIAGTLKKANLVPLLFEISLSAAARIIFDEGFETKQAILIKFSRSMTSFGLFLNGGIRFTTTLNYGYYNLVSSLAKKANIDIETARDWILASQNIAQEKREEVKKLFFSEFKVIEEEIKKIIEYGIQSYADEFRREDLEVILVGEGAKVYGFQEFISQNDLKVNIAAPRIKSVSSSLHFVSGREVFSHLILLGLGVRNLGKYKNLREINLIPDNLKKQYFGTAIYSRINKYLRMIIWNSILLLIGFFAYYYYINYEDSIIENEIQSVEAIANNEINAELDQNINLVNTSSKQIQNIINRRVDWTYIFNQIELAKPYTVQIDNLNISEEVEAYKSISGDKTAKVDKNTRYLIINGVAKDRDDILLFIEKLEKNEIFEEIKMPLSSIAIATNSQYSVYGKINISKLRKITDEKKED